MFYFRGASIRVGPQFRKKGDLRYIPILTICVRRFVQSLILKLCKINEYHPGGNHEKIRIFRFLAGRYVKSPCIYVYNVLRTYFHSRQGRGLWGRFFVAIFPTKSAWQGLFCLHVFWLMNMRLRSERYATSSTTSQSSLIRLNEWKPDIRC